MRFPRCIFDLGATMPATPARLRPRYVPRLRPVPSLRPDDHESPVADDEARRGRVVVRVLVEVRGVAVVRGAGPGPPRGAPGPVGDAVAERPVDGRVREEDERRPRARAAEDAVAR